MYFPYIFLGIAIAAQPHEQTSYHETVPFQMRNPSLPRRATASLEPHPAHLVPWASPTTELGTPPGFRDYSPSVLPFPSSLPCLGLQPSFRPCFPSICPPTRSHRLPLSFKGVHTRKASSSTLYRRLLPSLPFTRFGQSYQSST